MHIPGLSHRHAKSLSCTIAYHLVADHGGDDTDLTDHDDSDPTERLVFPDEILADVVVVGLAVDYLAAVRGPPETRV